MVETTGTTSVNIMSTYTIFWPSVVIYNIQYWVRFSEHINSNNILEAQTIGKVKVYYMEQERNTHTEVPINLSLFTRFTDTEMKRKERRQ